MHISIQEDGLLIRNINAYKPPAKLDEMIQQLAKAGVEFKLNGAADCYVCFGNNDKEEMFFPFSSEISEERAEEIQILVDQFRALWI